MKHRRKAREVALQALYQMELADTPTEWEACTGFEKLKSNAAARQYCEKLVKGVRENLKSIDSFIEDTAENWTVKRMAVVDRNILRVAAFELIHCDDVPFKVVINEAVELAKKFGSNESGAFVNGVLDRLVKDRACAEAAQGK